MEQIKSISTLLAGNPYPGRGIAVGLSADGRSVAFAYFIMGRSENSRNRVLRKIGDSLFTRAFDESKVKDPSLIIYRAVRFAKDCVIVTNGDQTDTIYDSLRIGESFTDALETRTYEPDAPNYTPRISALLRLSGGTFDYSMSILRRDRVTAQCERAYFDFTARKGEGRILHTYQTDGDPLPSFEGAPRAFPVPDDPRDFADELWQALDECNKISLYVCYLNVQNGEKTEIIYNKKEME